MDNPWFWGALVGVIDVPLVIGTFLSIEKRVFGTNEMNSAFSNAGKSMLKWGFRRLSGTGIGRNPLIKRAFMRIKPSMIEDTVTIDGQVMHLDAQDPLCLSLNGYYERNETAMVKRLVKPGMKAADIGANIGYYTLLLAKLVGPDGMVYSVEPMEKNYRLLQQNIKENGHRNVISHMSALSSASGTVFLSPTKNTAGFYLGTAGIPIEAMRGDDLIPGNLDFVKIDIEGAEGMAFEGMRRILSSPSVLVMFEYNAKAVKNVGADPMKAFSILVANNFYLYPLNDARPAKQSPVEIIKRYKSVNILASKDPFLMEKLEGTFKPW